MAKEKDDPFVGIAAVVGGTTIGMIALIVIFASQYAWVIGPVVLAMALMGIGLGYFRAKKK
ncbi:MAG: hypothetical protein ACOC32_00325 [Nanoarchaeota archaeon]